MKRLLVIIACISALSFQTLAQTDSSTNKLIEAVRKDGKVFGTLYSDYFYKAAGENVPENIGQYSKLEKDENAFYFRRIYFGYAHKFNSKFSAKIMYDASNSTTLESNKISGAIKYAYVKWSDIYPRADLTFGAQSTLSWSRFSEKVWGYRNLEKTIMDYNKISNSSDFGLSLDGKFDKSEKFGYALMVANGKGQKIENNKYKKVFGSLNAKLWEKKLWFEVYADYDKSDEIKSKQTTKAFIAYKTKKLTFGLEAYYQKHYGYETESTLDDFNKGISAYTTATILPSKLNIILRSDAVVHGEEANHTTFFSILALDYTPHKKIHIMPNVWTEYYLKKNSSSNQYETNITPRVTVTYTFNK